MSVPLQQLLDDLARWRLSLPWVARLSVAFAAAGLGGLAYVSTADPRAVGQRTAVAYVRWLNERFGSMYLPRRGAHVGWMQLCGATTLMCSFAFFPFAALPCAAALVLAAPPLCVLVLERRRARRLDDQVNGFALALANALKTTASIGDALRVVLTATTKPLRDELETALKQMRVGSALDAALLAMASRARSSSLDVVVSALLIARQTGGDLPRILETTATSLRELKRLEELTYRVSRTAKQSLAIAATITVGLAVMLPRVVPGFFDPLRTTLKGQITVAECAIVFCLALYLGYRFTRTDI